MRNHTAESENAANCVVSPRGPPVPPTGRAVPIEGLIVDRVADGKVAERWEQYDRSLMLQQMGLQ